MEQEDKVSIEFIISEAKDQLAHINSSIQATRDKTYILIGICFFILSFFSTSFFEKDVIPIKINMFYASLAMNIIVVLITTTAINPIKLRFEGLSPDGFDKIISEQKSNSEDIVKKSIVNTYRISINTNGTHLTTIAKAYKKAFFFLVIWSLCCSGFLIIERFI
ncbi:MAG: hypothetical protein M3R17_06575 [Bacteroidota bacterium]|nr:hypothetical protein [Bacteroidota bacterium]